MKAISRVSADVKIYFAYLPAKLQAMRVFIPLILVIAFLFYVGYLAFVKKSLKENLATVVYPGAFFIVVWGIFYLFLIW